MFDPELFSQRIITAVKGFFGNEVLKLKLELAKERDEISQRAAEAAISALPPFVSKEHLDLLTKASDEQRQADQARILELEATIKELKDAPAPEVNYDKVKTLVVEATNNAAESLKSSIKVDYDQITAIVREELDSRFKSVQIPEAEKVDYEKVAEQITKSVKATIAKIELPKPDSVNYVYVDAEISKRVDAATKDLKAPEPEKVDYDLVGELVGQMVSDAVAAVEIPAPEKVDYDQVKTQLDELVKEAVARIDLPSIDEQKIQDALQEKVFDNLVKLWNDFDLVGKFEGLASVLKQRSDAEIDRVPALIAESVQTVIQQVELPEGKSPDPDVILQMVVSSVRDYLSGMDLKPKELDVELVVGKVKDAVLASLPEPKPQEVRSLASAVIDDDGQLVLIFSDGAEKKLGIVRGRDGLSVEHFDVRVMPDGQHLEFSLKSHEGDILFTHELFLPIPVYKNVYKPDVDYTRGSVVTYAGSAWHAEKNSPVGAPGDHNSDWRLMVKKGRDYKQPVKVETSK